MPLARELAITKRGYAGAPAPERAAVGFLGGYGLTIAIARGINYVRERSRPAPRLRSVGRRLQTVPRTEGPRIHHFVPGVALTLVSATLAVFVRDDGREGWMAPLLGVGAGLTVDEFALLLDVDNAYWASEPFALAQAAAAGVATVAIGLHLHSRGAAGGHGEQDLQRAAVPSRSGQAPSRPRRPAADPPTRS